MQTTQRPMLQMNERPLDRLARAVVGAILLVVGISLFETPVALVEGAISLGLGTVGAIAFLSGLVGWCPFYAMLGFSTCSPARR